MGGITTLCGPGPPPLLAPTSAAHLTPPAHSPFFHLVPGEPKLFWVEGQLSCHRLLGHWFLFLVKTAMFRFWGCTPVRASFPSHCLDIIYFQWESQAALVSTQAIVPTCPWPDEKHEWNPNQMIYFILPRHVCSLYPGNTNPFPGGVADKWATRRVPEDQLPWDASHCSGISSTGRFTPEFQNIS